MATPARRARPKYNFRAFYVTVLFISSLALISLLADQGARYRYQLQSGVTERRSPEQLALALLKREEEQEVR
jgi:sodium/potassium/calcium exchanger 6